MIFFFFLKRHRFSLFCRLALNPGLHRPSAQSPSMWEFMPSSKF